jgi:hypothetical protein
MLAAASSTSGANLLVNGDFESAPILGVGQTAVPPGGAKAIFTDPSNFFYDESISGIQGWTYAVPFENGTHSDHGLGRRNAEFGRFDDGQSVFINNWNRMMSQTVAASFGAGDVLEASIDFGTLGDDTDAGRAGRFYLVAGEADPADLDQFSARSVILAELSVANSTWTGFTPDVVVGNGLFTRLNLSYTVGASDLALGLPLTIAFRTVSSSVGPTWWDDASLSVRPIPEPSSLVLLTAGAAAFAGLAAFRRSRGCSRDRAEASRRATNE